MNTLKRIFFIDDDVIIGMITKRLLEQMQVADEVIVCSDSYKGLELLKDYFKPVAGARPETAATLIFLDIEMPGIGGFEILTNLNELAAAGTILIQNTHFVIVTSHKGEKEIAKANAFKVLDIIEKPLRPQDVNALMAKIP